MELLKEFNMELVNLLVLGLLVISAFTALLLNRFDRGANFIGSGGCTAALIIKLLSLPFAVSSAACFQLPIVLVGIAAAIHSRGYMAGQHGKHRMNLYWFLFNMTLFAMLSVTMLPKGIAFLLMWELMGLTSFGLVAFDWQKNTVRDASWIYLIACEAGGLLLIWVLNLPENWKSAATVATVAAFGLKAGFPLLHVWLPEAHPAAPAPVSAVMSAAMIPLGFYGMFTWSPEIMILPAAGWCFLVLGICGMLLGILFGSAQSDLKRLLAYSSVENIGIMTLAFALSILGRSSGNQVMMTWGLLGGVLHMLNHALLKGTLFLGAGAVYKAAHTLNMDLLGGMCRKLPVTGTMFTLAGMGISGLPPFCGFAGELLIYMAAFEGIAHAGNWIFAASVASVVALALTGGTATAALVKCIAAVFGGEPRTEAAQQASGEDQRMIRGQILLFSAAMAMTFAAPYLVAGPLAEALQTSPEISGRAFAVLAGNAVFAFALLMLIGIFMYFRCKVLKRSDESSVTWDCGYAAPDARMQYTATAFIQPTADLFDGILRQQKQLKKVDSLFPESASLEVTVPDGGSRWLWSPLFKAASFVSEKVKHLQSGLLHVYILIMVLAVLLMLVWSFAGTSSGKTAVQSTLDQSEVIIHE